MDNRKSIEYNWEWVTASRILSKVPCELVYAQVVPTGAVATTAFYEGENAQAREIIQFAITVVLNWTFDPAVPVYCQHGLYLIIDQNTAGVFVQWRELMNEEKGG